MERLTINLQEGEKVFFTSDLHFGHDNIIKFCGRHYVDVKEMNRDLTERWNSRISDRDYVFVLGDFIWSKSRHDTRRYISRLDGRIHLLLGNHDKRSQYELCGEMINILDDIVELEILEDGKEPVVFTLCHYPLTTYSHINNKNHYHLFGHIHSQPGSILGEFNSPIRINPVGCCMDVGVDRHAMFPVTHREILKEIEEYWR